MIKYIIIGGKGSAVVVAEQIYDSQKKDKNVEFLGFAFDDLSFGKEINKFPILSNTKDIYSKYKKFNDVKFIFQLYRPDLMNERVELLASYRIPKEKFGTFIHHTALVSNSSKIGHGSAIMANTVINSNAIIGNHCTIHSNTLIGHDTKFGDNNFIAAHVVIGSNNEFGNKNFIGLNSSFNNYINVGDNCFVGMASNVLRDVGSDKSVYGNPAREFKSKIKPL